MKQFLKNILGFGSLCFLGVVLLIAVWGNYMPQLLKPNVNYRLGGNGHLFTRLQDLENRKDVDILFMGSSHAYRGFDTRIFDAEGYQSFNMGSSGQTPITGQALLKRYLKKLNPKLVIYEVFPGSFNSDGVESSVDIIANDKNDFYSAAMALKINHIKTYNTLIVGFFRDLLHLNKNFREPIKKEEDVYISGGYVEKDADFYFKEVTTNRKWMWKKSQIKAFEENLKIIKGQGSNMLLVKAPLTSKLYRAFTDNKDYDKMISKYGDYYNFNELISLEDTTHFYDLHHLNHDGVTLFNRQFLETVPLGKYID